MKLKTSFQVLTILALLAVGPNEAREIWFSHSPEQLYGEHLLFSDVDGQVYLGRNSSSLEIIFDKPVELFVADLRGENFYHSGRVVNFNKLAQGVIYQDEPGIRKSSTAGHLPDSPGRLFIHTESELTSNIALVGIIFILTGYLTYLVADYQSKFSPKFHEGTEREGSLLL